MFKGCSEISVSVIIKKVQHVKIIGTFCLTGGNIKLLGCGLLVEINTQADTMN